VRACSLGWSTCGLAAVALAVAACGDDKRERERAPAPPVLRGTLAFSSSDLEDVLTSPVGDPDPRRVTARRGREFDPSFSPDGRRIAYRDSRRGINRDDEIWVVDADGRGARNLTRDHANDWSPAWSPDGRTIAFASTRSGALRLWLMNADGSRPRQLGQSQGEYPTWSPDGARLAFSMLGAGASQVGVIGRDGRGEHAITPITENSELPAWSRDGKRIAFSRGFEGARSIWTMRPDGSDARRVIHAGSDDVGPVWSPDGGLIAFARRGRLMIVRPDGRGLRDLGIDGSLPDWTDAQ
jgi:TolB protein